MTAAGDGSDDMGLTPSEQASADEAIAQQAIAQTQGWIERVVVGLDLCPFARRVLHGGLIRYRYAEVDGAELLEVVADELEALDAARGHETTLILAPALATFEAFLDAVALADALVDALGYRGVFQIASFHPAYRFADAPADDLGHFTNRAPHPTLHLLREIDVAEAARQHPDVEGIPAANVARLRALGRAAVLARVTGQ